MIVIYDDGDKDDEEVNFGGNDADHEDVGSDDNNEDGDDGGADDDLCFVMNHDCDEDNGEEWGEVNHEDAAIDNGDGKNNSRYDDDNAGDYYYYEGN